jgi:hypothetical protein
MPAFQKLCVFWPACVSQTIVLMEKLVVMICFYFFVELLSSYTRTIQKGSPMAICIPLIRIDIACHWCAEF